jgi:SAM-dependent methyltransferase
VADANAEQRSYWNSQAGPLWVANQERLDRQIRAHGERALAALAPAEGERVLDLGCGCGDTSLALARRVGPRGFVLGLDLSEPMLARARERAAAAGLAQLAFRAADLQSDALEAEGFDAAYSRFGVMFFVEPELAFANVRRALRPGGRLAFVCWRPLAENEWVRVPLAAAAAHLPPPKPPPPGAPGPFSLSDAGRVERILARAGFEGIRLEPVDLPLVPGGGDLDEAVAILLEIGPLAAALREAGAEPALRARVAAELRRALAGHVREGRVELGSAVWLAEAHEPRAA